MAKRGYPETLVPAPRSGKKALPRKSFGTRLPEDVGDRVDALPDKAAWIRRKLVKGAIEDGLIQDEALIQALIDEWLQQDACLGQLLALLEDRGDKSL